VIGHHEFEEVEGAVRDRKRSSPRRPATITSSAFDSDLFEKERRILSKWLL